MRSPSALSRGSRATFAANWRAAAHRSTPGRWHRGADRGGDARPGVARDPRRPRRDDDRDPARRSPAAGSRRALKKLKKAERRGALVAALRAPGNSPIRGVDRSEAQPRPRRPTETCRPCSTRSSTRGHRATGWRAASLVADVALGLAALPLRPARPGRLRARRCRS